MVTVGKDVASHGEVGEASAEVADQNLIEVKLKHKKIVF